MSPLSRSEGRWAFSCSELSARALRQSVLDRQRVVAIACGDGPHALALTCPVTCGGGVFSWGRNGKGELGLG